MKLFRLLTAVSLVALSGCAHQLQHASSQTPTNKVEPSDPSLVEGPGWSMTLALPFMWKKVAPLEADDESAKTELCMETKDKIGGFPVELQVLTGKHGGDDIAFIKGVLARQEAGGVIKILKVKGIKLASGDVAALGLVAHEAESGQVVTLELITSRDGAGFIVACDGSLDQVEKVMPLCIETMQTFTLKGEKKQPVQQKVPMSTPESTQTQNDTQL